MQLASFSTAADTSNRSASQSRMANLFQPGIRAGSVVLPLHLTHSVLADLVAARRPTVTSSLTELTRRGLVEPQTRGWLLRGEPPGELLELAICPVVAAESAEFVDLNRCE